MANAPLVVSDTPKPVVRDRSSDAGKAEESTRTWAREVTFALRALWNQVQGLDTSVPAATTTIIQQASTPGPTPSYPVDGPQATGSLRTLGTGHLQAAAGDDPRFGTSGPPSGPAGGDLAGMYPNPTVPRIHDLINVKNFGAKGDGVSDDTLTIQAAITAAIAIGANVGIYFPPGDYPWNPMAITGILNLAVFGDGVGVSTLRSNLILDPGDGHGPTVGSQTLIIRDSCTKVSVYGLTINGACTYRKPGQQAVVLDCNELRFFNNEILNSGEFALCLGRTTATRVSDVIIVHNRLGLNWADGINLYKVDNAVVANNLVDGPDDDLIALGQCTNVNVSGNECRARNDLGTAWGRGLAILGGCDGITCCGNLIEKVKQYGVFISADGSTRPNDITLVGNTIRNVAIHSGSGLFVQQTDNVTLIDTRIYNPASGNCMIIADWTNLKILGGVLTQTLSQFCRGIMVDDTAGIYAASWVGLTIKGVDINLLGAANNECIYLDPEVAVTLNTVLIDNVSSRQTPAGNYIWTNQLGTSAKIVNCTSMEGRAITNGGTGLAPTLVNNN